MTDQMNPAERLRTAATRLRKVAEDAPPGPWRYSEHGNNMDGPTEVWVTSPVSDDPMLTGGYDSFSGYAAILASMMSPPVALALAEMLEGDAEAVDGIEARYFEDGWMKTVLAVADAVLGEGVNALDAATRWTPQSTLGDIADELRAMKKGGMTRASVLYALDQVYFEDACAPHPTGDLPGEPVGPGDLRAGDRVEFTYKGRRITCALVGESGGYLRSGAPDSRGYRPYIAWDGGWYADISDVRLIERATQADPDTVTLPREDAERLLDCWAGDDPHAPEGPMYRRVRAALGWGDSDDA